MDEDFDILAASGDDMMMGDDGMGDFGGDDGPVMKAADIKVLGLLGRDDLKKLCVYNFPEWISFPQFEQVKWLNKHLSKLWPFVAQGEEHRLFWPAQTEFVRMAAQFNATIVPFGVVGEDDLWEVLCTFDDIRNAPFGQELMQAYSNHLKLRDVDHEVFFPGVYLKFPGRFYYRFGKPIPTRGRQDVLTDRQAANDLYLHVKSEVESMISYLLEKRVEDKYRNIVPRILYKAARGPNCEVPTFHP